MLSVVDTVRWTVDEQRDMAELSAGVPPEQRIALLLPVLSVGDIIIDADVLGDGVNVAAPLQTEPRGICVSRVVRDQALDKLSFASEDLGP